MAKNEEPVLEVGPSSKKKEESEAARVARETTRAMMEEMLPAMIAATRATSAPTGPMRAMPPPSQGCGECGQLLVACKGEHEKVIVFPRKFPEFAEWFPGAFINGVRYLSNHGNHEVLVPKDAVGGILHIVQTFEDNERETRLGRVKHHNSGNVHSPTKVTGAEGWR